MRFWVQREGAAHPARSIDAAIKEPTYDRDCRLANGIYRPRISYRARVPRRLIEE
jgi:hypothetical protein